MVNVLNNIFQLTGTSIADEDDNGHDGLTSVFPSLGIVADDQDDVRGFLSFGGFMAGWEAPAVGR